MEQAGERQYNFVSSPIPFECPEAILSTPLSSPTPHTMIMDSNSGVFTPIPCQPRVSTPYPVIDSVISGKDWPAGLSPENRIFPSSWGFESTVGHIGQEFQGSLLPATMSTSHSLHHYTFPQTWHHTVTTQNLSSYSLQNNDFWYPGDSPLIDGFGTADVESDIIEQDSKVTSSTELGYEKCQPYMEISTSMPTRIKQETKITGFNRKGYEKCQPYMEISASMPTRIKQETESTGFNRKALSGYEKCQPYMEISASMPARIKQETESSGFNSKDVDTQTPWKMRKPKMSPETQRQNKKKCQRPRKKVDPINYLQQKAMQRKREKAIRDKLEHLSTMLPWAELKGTRPSRKEILEKAISRIVQLQEDIREAYLQKGLKTEDVKAALQDNLMLNFSNGSLGITDLADEVPMISEESSSFPSTPELAINESVSVTSASPISELGSQECEEPVEADSVKGVKTDELTHPHIKRPMNSFLLFSREYRGIFKRLYPGKDNRKISTLLAEEWRRMKPEEKQPYKERQKELMRLTKESHPDFKY